MYQFSKYPQNGSKNQYLVLIEVKPYQSHILDGNGNWIALYRNFLPFVICSHGPQIIIINFRPVRPIRKLHNNYCN